MIKKILIVLALIASFVAGTQAVSFAAQLYQVLFSHITTAQSFSIGTSSTTVISDVNFVNRAYFSIVNSGAVGASCYPIAPSSTYQANGAWYLAPSGGSIQLDGPAIWGGQVTCFTQSGNTTLGVVEN